MVKLINKNIRNFVNRLIIEELKLLLFPGKKVSVFEPHEMVDAVKEAIREKKSIEGTTPEQGTTPEEGTTPAEEEVLEESKRSKG